MNDLIRRTDAKNAISNYCKMKLDEIMGEREEVPSGELQPILKLNKELSKKIREIPTVEAVPVVRCINCQHWGTGVTGETEHVKCCEYAKYMVGEDGYCCYGADMRKKV